jgi:hypothetical protein
MGVDGFRLDAAKHLVEDGKVQTNTPETLAWLEGFHAAREAAKPGSLLVGEVWDPPSIAGRCVPGSVDLTFDFGLATGIRLAIARAWHAGRTHRPHAALSTSVSDPDHLLPPARRRPGRAANHEARLEPELLRT